MNRPLAGKIFKFGSGFLLVVSFLPLAFMPEVRAEAIPPYIVGFLISGGIYFFAITTLKKASPPLGFIWVVAILARSILLLTTPILSDDVNRYMWEGHLSNNAINPYTEPVDSIKLDYLDTSYRKNINHPEMASPYPPMAQFYFHINEIIAPENMKIYQFSSVFFDLFTALIIMLLLKKLDIEKAAVLIYLWNPLIIVEFSHSAHLDSLMLFFTMLAWFFVFGKRSRRMLSPLFLGLATLTKFVTGIFTVLLLRRWSWSGLLIFISVFVVPFFLFSSNAGWGVIGDLDGRGVFGALKTFLSYWNFNQNPLFEILNMMLDPFSGEIGDTTRLFSGALFMVILLWTGVKAWKNDGKTIADIQKDRGLIRLAMIPIGGFILLSPTVHPWYVTLMVSILPFFIASKGDKGEIAYWIYPGVWFSLTVSLTYLAYLDPEKNTVPVWVLWLEYLPLILGLLYAWIKNRNVNN